MVTWLKRVIWPREEYVVCYFYMALMSIEETAANARFRFCSNLFHFEVNHKRKLPRMYIEYAIYAEDYREYKILFFFYMLG